MLSDKSERAAQRRNKVAKAIVAFKNTDLAKLSVEYFHLCLDQKVNLLLNSTGEEAIALRGEMRCIKHLLSVFEQGDTPFTDSITPI
jgi:hypothetical protein